MFEIKEIPINDIIISNRARKNFDDIDETRSSIKEHGLLYPVLIDDKMKLIDGECRIRIFKELERSTITCRILPDIAADDAKILERIANVARKAFEWHEELSIRSDLHDMWVKTIEGWNYRKSSQKLNISLGGLSSDLALAKVIKSFPELTQFKKKSQARDAYKKMQSQAEAIQAVDGLSEDEQAKLQSMLAGNTKVSDVGAIVETKPTKPATAADDDIPCAMHSDHHPGEVLAGKEDTSEPIPAPEPELPKHLYEVISNHEFIPKIPDNTVGFIELDPPYAINFNETYGKVGDIETTEDDWTIDQLTESMNWMLPELYKKLLDNSWVLCWTAKEHWIWINEVAKDAGFNTQEPGIWAKPGGSSNTPSTNMVSCYEMFLLFRKGKATFNTPSMHNVINFAPPSASQRQHQWEKPMDMYDFFMKAMGKPGSIFLSPFAGSGNSMVSAALNSMTPMGCDMKQKYFYQFYNNFKNHFYTGK